MGDDATDRRWRTSRLLRAAVIAATLIAAALALTTEPARACSCAVLDPRDTLAHADGAFIGVLLERGEETNGTVTLVFSVEERIKGSLGVTVAVRTASNSAACGIEARVGTRIGLFLDRVGDEWRGSLCGEVDPARLREAAQPLPVPNGRGPVALLVGGRFGPARMLALDAEARTLAYGLGDGHVGQISVCPGGRRLGEIAYLNPGFELVIRDVQRLGVIRRQRLALPGRRIPAALLCDDPTGLTVVVFAVWREGDAPFRSALYRLTRVRVSRIWSGTTNHVSLAPATAYVGEGEAGRNLISVDLRTGRVAHLASIPSDSDLVADATGKRLAGVASRLAEPSRIVLVDLTQGSPRVHTAPLATAEVYGAVFWLPKERFLFLPWYGRDTARVFDLSLRTRSRFRWRTGSAALVGSRAVGVDDRGTLATARLPSGPMRVVRRLPGRPEVIVSAVP